MNVKDFLCDENGDLRIENGDFVIGDSDEQHINDILISFPGYWKEFPSLGAGVPSLLKSVININIVESLIKSQLEDDGYQVGRPSVVNNSGQVIITPNAKRINF